MRRAFLHMGPLDRTEYHIEELRTLEGPGWWARLLARFRKQRRPLQSIDRVGAADLVALDDFIGGWDHWTTKRRAVQDRRRRSDEEILPLFLEPLWCIEGDPAYRALHEGLVDFLDLGGLFGTKQG